ncbi:hypothetical protein DSO57_1036816 [Entomophthora muscae]|uniref:Uncharacterized protein n=1 Tax=Entomophthora muscae TaxID=34485 RepID=A0ACC2TXR9_9FUNG|nr:hypothetical protein DSO57_1036816 [Entomophthora muscae]
MEPNIKEVVATDPSILHARKDNKLKVSKAAEIEKLVAYGKSYLEGNSEEDLIITGVGQLISKAIIVTEILKKDSAYQLHTEVSLLKSESTPSLTRYFTLIEAF